MAGKMSKLSILDRGIDAVSRSLVEFGYPDAKPELIRKHYDTWKAGKEDADIIFMFAKAQFEDNPTIFGSPS